MGKRSGNEGGWQGSGGVRGPRAERGTAKGESERARERAWDRGKRVSPNEAWTSRIS